MLHTKVVGVFFFQYKSSTCDKKWFVKRSCFFNLKKNNIKNTRRNFTTIASHALLLWPILLSACSQCLCHTKIPVDSSAVMSRTFHLCGLFFFFLFTEICFCLPQTFSHQTLIFVYNANNMQATILFSLISFKDAMSCKW